MHYFVVIVVISLFLHCIFNGYSSIQLSRHKCVIKSVFSVSNDCRFGQWKVYRFVAHNILPLWHSLSCLSNVHLSVSVCLHDCMSDYLSIHSPVYGPPCLKEINEQKNEWMSESYCYQQNFSCSNSLVSSEMLYGYESWTISAQMNQLINSFETSAYRIMTGVKCL